MILQDGIDYYLSEGYDYETAETLAELDLTVSVKRNEHAKPNQAL